MAFEVRAKRLGPGSYRLEFGKGGNKIVADATSQKGKWSLTIKDSIGVARGFAAFADAKQYFGEYARAGYKGKLNENGQSRNNDSGRQPESADERDDEADANQDNRQPGRVQGADLHAGTGHGRGHRPRGEGPVAVRTAPQAEGQEADDPAKPMTSHDALRLVIDWARRQHRDLRVPPFADCVRVLEREVGHV